MRILAVGAHPDDIEFHCAGTLAKYANNGDDVFIAHLCNGCYGSKDTPPEELAKIRGQEAKNSANIIGATLIEPIADDLGLFPTEEARLKVVDIIRQAKPDLIITHSTNDYMPDHNIAGQLVFDAAFTATLPVIKTKYPAHEKIMPIYNMETAKVSVLNQMCMLILPIFLKQKRRCFFLMKANINDLRATTSQTLLILLKKLLDIEDYNVVWNTLKLLRKLRSGEEFFLTIF